jgi:hypothetical protein
VLNGFRPSIPPLINDVADVFSESEIVIGVGKEEILSACGTILLAILPRNVQPCLATIHGDAEYSVVDLLYLGATQVVVETFDDIEGGG